MFIIWGMTMLPHSCVRQPPRTSHNQRNEDTLTKILHFSTLPKRCLHRWCLSNYRWFSIKATNCWINGTINFKACQGLWKRFMHHEELLCRHKTFIHPEFPAIRQRKLPNFQIYFIQLRNKTICLDVQEMQIRQWCILICCNLIQYTNQQMHSIKHNKTQITKYNSWQVSNSCMFQHQSAILMESTKTKEHANPGTDCPPWYTGSSEGKVRLVFLCCIRCHENCTLVLQHVGVWYLSCIMC